VLYVSHNAAVRMVEITANMFGVDAPALLANADEGKETLMFTGAKLLFDKDEKQYRLMTYAWDESDGTRLIVLAGPYGGWPH
jgi:hypothetical protein